MRGGGVILSIFCQYIRIQVPKALVKFENGHNFVDYYIGPGMVYTLYIFPYIPVNLLFIRSITPNNN